MCLGTVINLVSLKANLQKISVNTELVGGGFSRANITNIITNLSRTNLQNPLSLKLT